MASHAFDVGEVVDIIIGAVGVLAIGFAVFEGVDELRDFAALAYRARDDDDLHKAGRHFAKAVSILGIEAVFAFLFRGRPRTYHGKPLGVGREPARDAGWRAKPTVKGSPDIPRRRGSTDAWGNVTYSLRGSTQDQALVIAHERIHQILTPKLYVLRRVRVQARTNSYFRSSPSRYL